jgi:hypothetical protein
MVSARPGRSGDPNALAALTTVSGICPAVVASEALARREPAPASATLRLIAGAKRRL